MTPSEPVVLVVGPPLAGVDGVIEALRVRLPGIRVITDDGALSPGAPDAVLAVVSAVAPMTRSDWDLIERAAARADVVIGVVSKIDAHRGWRAVRDADQTLVAGWSAGYRDMAWAAVAAAPDIGTPQIDELVELLRRHLRNPAAARAHPPRTQLSAAPERTRAQRPAPGRGPSPADVVELRTVLQTTRLRLLRYVRDRTAALRGELREHAATVSVGDSGRFEDLVRGEAERFGVDLRDEITRAVHAAADELGLDARGPAMLTGTAPSILGEVDRMPSSSRRLEGRLMAVLGIGFGLGIALASSRLLAGVAPGLSIAGLAAGAVVGLTVLVWVVRVRGLLHERALLDRWVTEVVASLRWHGETMVAERLVGAESRWAIGGRGGAIQRVSNDLEFGPRDVTDQYEW